MWMSLTTLVSDHRIVRAKLCLNLKRERRKLVGTSNTQNGALLKVQQKYYEKFLGM